MENQQTPDSSQTTVQSSPPPPQIPTYLWQSIVVTILCCLPLGIPAIIYASQVNTKLVQGDIEGAKETSRKARTWCWIAFGVGIGLQLIWIVTYALIGAAALMGQAG